VIHGVSLARRVAVNSARCWFDQTSDSPKQVGSKVHRVIAEFFSSSWRIDALLFFSKMHHVQYDRLKMFRDHSNRISRFGLYSVVFHLTCIFYANLTSYSFSQMFRLAATVLVRMMWVMPSNESVICWWVYKQRHIDGQVLKNIPIIFSVSVCMHSPYPNLRPFVNEQSHSTIFLVLPVIVRVTVFKKATLHRIKLDCVKFSSAIAQVNTYRLLATDFRFDVTLSRWRS